MVSLLTVYAEFVSLFPDKDYSLFPDKNGVVGVKRTKINKTIRCRDWPILKD